MLFGIKGELQTNFVSKKNKEEKFLGITFDNKLDISSHLTSITKKANIKLSNISRVQKYMTPEQKTFLTSSFIKSQFNYCPLIWLSCLKKALHRLNNIYERSLRLKQQDQVSKSITLLVNANEKPIHEKCLEFLMIEVYKYLSGLPPQIMNDIFKPRKNIYNLRNVHLFEKKTVRSRL